MSVPSDDILLTDEFEAEKVAQSNLAWKIAAGRMYELVDELRAVNQAAKKRLDTEAGLYEIYSEFYGLKTLDLIGKEIRIAVAILKRRIETTLLADDRILSVYDFTQSELKRKITLTFKVNSVYGEFELEKVVQI